MPRDFIPSKEAQLVTWSANFATRIVATPTEYGLTAPQATQMVNLQEDFAAAYNNATNPSTRTRGAIAAKRVVKKTMVAYVRELARIIQATPTVTDQQKVNAGLPVHSTEPTPVPVPDESPVLEIVSTMGRTIKINLRTVGSDRRGKPDGVAGASVFSFVGDDAPSDIAAWKFEGSTTRTNVDVEFAPIVPAGSKVWLTAFWFNPRTQSGPACDPISTYIAGGVSLAA